MSVCPDASLASTITAIVCKHAGMDSALALLVLLTVAVWFWSSSRIAAEIALHHARKACDDLNVQLLDGSVSLKKIWPVRRDNGWPTLLRAYSFDYTQDGLSREHGHIVLIAGRVKYLSINTGDSNVITPVDD